MTQARPDQDATKFTAPTCSGTLIAIYPVTDETVCQTSLTMKDEKHLKLDVDPTVLPKEGTPVKLIIEAVK